MAALRTLENIDLMRHIFLIFSVVAWLGACGGDDTERIPEPAPQPAGEIEFFSPKSLSFDADGGAGAIEFWTSAAWRADVGSSDAGEWCVLLPTSGAAGDGEVKVVVSPNDTYGERTTKVLLKADDVIEEIAVTQERRGALLLSDSEFEVAAGGGTIRLDIRANVPYEYEVDADWVTYVETRALAESQLVFRVAENEYPGEREGVIVISSELGREEVTVRQRGSGTLYVSSDYSSDGEAAVLQRATEGRGIDIVLMGDGFSDRQIASGYYDEVMRKAMEFFFGEEPYRSFRHLFDVTSVRVVSRNEGYVDGGSTALEGYFGDLTIVGGDYNKVWAYAWTGLGDNPDMDKTMIIVMMNSPRYAGTCYFFFPSDAYTGDYGGGLSISYFPIGENDEMFESVLHHEAGGHGFAKLSDEYDFYEDSMLAMPQEMIDAYLFRQSSYGWFPNVDFTSDVTKVKWSRFISDPRYAAEELGAYEGAATYRYGIWRPTYNSIMRDNIGGFNAPSREAIYYRIHKLAYGDAWQYDYEKFVEYDAVNRTGTMPMLLRTPVVRKDFVPLHPPVVVREGL